jgi:hypothetical protein
VIDWLGNPAHHVEPISVVLFNLLVVWSQLVTRLEGSSCALGRAYPESERTTSYLAAIREGHTDDVIANVHDAGIQLINQYTIGSSHDLLQLSCILIPPGRNAAFEQLHQCLMSEPQQQPAFELAFVNFEGQLADYEEEFTGKPESQRNEEEEEVESEVDAEMDGGSERDDADRMDASGHNCDETDVALLGVPDCEFP